MKYIRDAIEKLKNAGFVKRLKKVKNVEIVIAVILALVAAVCLLSASAKKKAKTGSTELTISTADVEMDAEEQRLSALISEISGVGKSRVMISLGADSEIVGVVVVAVGAKEMDTRVKILRCVEKATGVSVDRIEVFEMENGG